MVFTAPGWAPELVNEPPNSVSLVDFMLDERWGRPPLDSSQPPFVCGLTHRSFTAVEQARRTQDLARALANELDWQVNVGAELEKVLAVFTHNTIDIMTIHWAVHRLNGVVSPVNACSSTEELAFQSKDSGASALVTCSPLLPTALRAAAKAGIPEHSVFLCDLPAGFTGKAEGSPGTKTVEDLIRTGRSMPKLPGLQWSQGQGSRQTAFICYSSGTSGTPVSSPSLLALGGRQALTQVFLQKGVRISHRNVIANVLQLSLYESSVRRLPNPDHEVVLGLMPQNHIYALVIICHAAPYRGDKVVVLPNYNLRSLLQSIQTHDITTLFLVPSIIVDLARESKDFTAFDLKFVRKIVTGAAPLGQETAKQLQKRFPMWRICQGYGMTETATVISWTSEADVTLGSSGCLLSGTRVKLVTPEGQELTGFDQPGEVLIRSPSVTLGYHNNEEATRECYSEDSDGRWFRTGDEAVFRRSRNGHDHIWITDRVKYLIKVKGLQVAPAELEAHLLQHPMVVDCAVIGIPDERAGELPKAFVVLAPEKRRYANELDAIVREFHARVDRTKAKYKRLGGGIEFVDTVPRNPTGKILRRKLGQEEIRKAKRAHAARL